MNAQAEGTAFYEVEARDAAQVLCRILGLFAQQNRPLASVLAHSHGDRLHAMLRLAAIDAQRAAVLAEKMRALPMVESVEFIFAPAERGGSVGCGGLRSTQDAQHVAAGHLADILG